MVVFTSISIAKAGSSSQSPIFTPFNSTGGGCSTQANTYSDRTRSQGASSDPGEGSLARRLNGRQLYVWHAVDSEGEVPGHPRSTTAGRHQSNLVGLRSAALRPPRSP